MTGWPTRPGPVLKIMRDGNDIYIILLLYIVRVFVGPHLIRVRRPSGFFAVTLLLYYYYTKQTTQHIIYIIIITIIMRERYYYTTLHT